MAWVEAEYVCDAEALKELSVVRGSVGTLIEGVGEDLCDGSGAHFEHVPRISHALGVVLDGAHDDDDAVKMAL